MIFHAFITFENHTSILTKRIVLMLFITRVFEILFSLSPFEIKDVILQLMCFFVLKIHVLGHEIC